MTAKRPGEIIHMTFITTNTISDGKVAVLISVDNYSGYVFGVAVERDISFHNLNSHIDGILKSVNEKHPSVNPLFIMAYGKHMIKELEELYIGRATFLFDPVLADEVAMQPAKDLMKQVFGKNR
jgi:hypothetical protein